MMAYPYPYDFNPRPPCGGRLDQNEDRQMVALFQSTAPVWGPTDFSNIERKIDGVFQSTAPVWGPTALPQED